MKLLILQNKKLFVVLENGLLPKKHDYHKKKLFSLKLDNQ